MHAVTPATPAAGSTPAADAADPRRYRQIASAVRRDITAGTLAPGHRVTVTTLADRHRSARQTAAKALQLLAAEGLLARFPGHGYTVQSPAPVTPAGAR